MPRLQIGRYGSRMAKDQRTLAALLTEFRRAAGLSKVELARRAGTTRQTIHEIETGARLTPGVDTLKALARACGRDPMALIERTVVPARFEDALAGIEEAAKRRGIHAPTKDEIALLKSLPPALWNKIPPDADVLLDQVEIERRRKLRQSGS